MMFAKVNEKRKAGDQKIGVSPAVNRSREAGIIITNRNGFPGSRHERKTIA
ncbi:MAG: hypothetical protein NT126_09050 [Bacteroidetes bacterium]|nr:hypothetical protein [Bacteroidota bacterium]